jgi:hypothetical protein
MPPIDSTDPTIPVTCEDRPVIVDHDAEQLAALILTYHNTQVNLSGAQAEVNELTRLSKTPKNSAMRHFTVADALAVKESGTKLAEAKAKLQKAEMAHSAANVALDQWIPSSLKPFLQVSGCITVANSDGEYPFIGVTMPKDKYMIIQAPSEAAIIHEARRQKELTRHDSEY